MDTFWSIAARLGEFAAIFLVVAFVAHVLVRVLPPARLRAALGERPVRSTVAALLLGALTPFCSCSTVPLTAGMAAAGVPVVATTAFLVVSPLVNPATVALLVTLGSPVLAAGFVLASLVMALVVALAVGAAGVRPRSHIAAMASADGHGVSDGGADDPGATSPRAAPSRAWGALLRGAALGALQDFWRLLPVVIVVIALAAALSGRVDIGAVGRVMDAAGPFAVPLAVLIGIPVYASTAVLLPLGAALLAGGAGLGVVSAFLIGATGLSLPEGVLLHRLMGGRYLATVAATFVVAAVALGYLIEAFTGAPLPPVVALR